MLNRIKKPKPYLRSWALDDRSLASVLHYRAAIYLIPILNIMECSYSSINFLRRVVT